MKRLTLIVTLLIFISACSSLQKTSDNAAATCQGAGPQTPRDIDSLAGSNKSIFSIAPAYQQMNLCDIHFHEPAEHKAKDFSVKPKDGFGYQCNNSQSLTDWELTVPTQNICNGLKPGDTIEVHWVYTSCEVQPAPTLSSCFSAVCSNPNLRVETQVFTVVNDSSALNFNDLSNDPSTRNGYYQAKALPNNTGDPAVFLGSTTGPSFNNAECSNFQVSWSVRPQCAKVDINSLGEWCTDNVFNENHAHGVRELVTNPKLLSEIN